MGVDDIRIPIGWHHYTVIGPEYKVSADIVGRMDDFVSAAHAEGLAAMMNIHHFDVVTSDPAGQTPRFPAVWRQDSEHYAGHPATLEHERLNESKDKGTTEVISPIFAQAVKVSRAADPARASMIGQGGWTSVSERPGLRLPDDDSNIATVRSYDPFFFTHQGAPWTNRGDDGRPKGIQFPGPRLSPLVPDPSLDLTPGFQFWIRQYNTTPAGSNPSWPPVMDKSAAANRVWSDSYGRPVYLGEFGAIKSSHPKSRGSYYREFRAAGLRRLASAGLSGTWRGLQLPGRGARPPRTWDAGAPLRTSRTSPSPDVSDSFAIEAPVYVGASAYRKLWVLTWTPGLRDGVKMFLHRPVPRSDK